MIRSKEHYLIKKRILERLLAKIKGKEEKGENYNQEVIDAFNLTEEMLRFSNLKLITPLERSVIQDHLKDIRYYLISKMCAEVRFRLGLFK